MIGMETKLQLNPTKILNKEFKIDFKGYNSEEVDYFLDIVMSDYEVFKNLLNMAYEKIEVLNNRNAQLKEMVARLEKENALQKDQLAIAEENPGGANVDILKRLSALEKEVFKNR